MEERLIRSTLLYPISLWFIWIFFPFPHLDSWIAVCSPDCGLLSRLRSTLQMAVYSPDFTTTIYISLFLLVAFNIICCLFLFSWILPPQFTTAQITWAFNKFKVFVVFTNRDSKFLETADYMMSYFLRPGRRFKSFRMLRCIDWWIISSVLKKRRVFLLQVKQIKKLL
jgi:hypothetical protein